MSKKFFWDIKNIDHTNKRINIQLRLIAFALGTSGILLIEFLKYYYFKSQNKNSLVEN